MDQALAMDSALADHEARFEQLFRNYHTCIFVYLCRLVDDRRQAEDLAQDTLVKAYRALARSLRGWQEVPGHSCGGRPAGGSPTVAWQQGE